MEQLKNCPFCGGKAKLHATTTRTYPNHCKHYCYCDKCCATGESFSDFEDDGSSAFKAIEAWNRRPDAVPAADDAIKNCAKIIAKTNWKRMGNDE